jgi:hypothetical protein
VFGKPARPHHDQAIQDGAADPRSAHPASFYALPFAPQMIVWAMRKHLTALASGARGADDVLAVFHLADWGELHASVVGPTDVLASMTPLATLELHAVACPCLAPHEAYLLNALAHVQSGRRDEAILCLCEILAPAGARLALPHVETIAHNGRDQRLRFVYVNLSTLPRRPPRTAGGLSRVH